MSEEIINEERLAENIAERTYGHKTESGSAGKGSLSVYEEDSKKFEFDEVFQSKVAALQIRDSVFAKRTKGLIQPKYFNNMAEAVLVDLAVQYYNKYGKSPDRSTFTTLLRDSAKRKAIRSDLVPEVVDSLKKLYRLNISDRDYAVDQIESFARHQALENAILESVDLIEKRDFDKVYEKIKQAQEVGANSDIDGYDYFARIDDRTEYRKRLKAGLERPRGIPTGLLQMDRVMYSKGWGRKELSLLMGGPKVGKSIGLLNFGMNAALSGFNVLFVTLEVSKEICEDRLDAMLAEMATTELTEKIIEVKKRLDSKTEKAGRFITHEFSAGLNPSTLRRLINGYQQNSLDPISFDLIVVDYLDLMKPDIITRDPIENSKQVATDLRSIAQEEDMAVLSATQTNREGAKAAIANMEHVAEDFNRIRIADLVISINKSIAEAANDEARLYFVANRNGRQDFCIFIKQKIERMKFISSIVRVE